MLKSAFTKGSENPLLYAEYLTSLTQVEKQIIRTIYTDVVHSVKRKETQTCLNV